LEIAVEGDRTSQLETAVVLRVRGKAVFDQTRKDRAGDDGKCRDNDANELGRGGFPGQSGSDSELLSSPSSPPRQF
jgi:hypothetical protein